MRNKSGPQITISGALMVPVPTDITAEQSFGNFEELARNANVGSFNDRLQLIGALKTLGGLLGVIPELSARDALSVFEQISHAHPCDHNTRMALLKSVDVLEDVVETEEARIDEAAAKEGETEADGPSEAETSTEG